MIDRLIFLLDVDNTLLANDEVKATLDQHIQVELGEALAKRFWEIYEEVRTQQKVVDIPLALQRLRSSTSTEELSEQTYMHVVSLFDNYPFIQNLYPHVIETLHYLRTLGLTVIVSDGDQYFQAEKIVNSDLATTVEGRVLIYIHKQEHLTEILQQYPATHYAMIDDKAQILAESKAILGSQLCTVFVRQGKYAQEPLPPNFSPDICVDHIGDLRDCPVDRFLLEGKSY